MRSLLRGPAAERLRTAGVVAALRPAYVFHSRFMPNDALLDAALASIRSSVRRASPYHVGAPSSTRAKLNQNESPFDLPEDCKHELAGALVATPLNRYPGEWPEELRAALASRLPWKADGILVGNGSNDLMYTVAAATVAPGVPVVLPDPLFSLYGKIARSNGGALTTVGPRSDLAFDTDALVKAIGREDPRLVVLATPNNPTGLALALPDVLAVAAATPGILLVDEAYVEFSDVPSALPELERFPNMLLLRTFSKAFGLAGLRLGYLAGHPAVIGELRKARYPFAVDRLSEMAALALLSRPELVAERVAAIRRETARLHRRLAAMEHVTALRPQANFVVFRPAAGARHVQDMLARRGVSVRNMGGYAALRGYLRVTAGTERENNIFLAELQSALL